VLVHVCHDEIGVECDAKQAAVAKAWLEKAMTGGLEAVLNGTVQRYIQVEVEGRIARSWR
jgi:hypothetical protein